jgi:DNA polymerase family A
VARKLKFQDIDNPVLLQQNLFLPPSVSAGGDFPPILDSDEGVRAILADAADGIGLDLEFSPTTGKPSILGVANRRMTSGVPWSAELASLVVETSLRTGAKIVGHSVIGADRPILEGALGIKTPLHTWEDSMIRHYLCNPFLTKTPGKEEDEDDTGAMGYMGLWTMASIYTDLPAWKTCRGKACEGPCPLHNPFAYCAIDSWAGLESNFGTTAEMKRKGIPESLYVDMLELTEICVQMEDKGIKVDRAFVRSMEEDFEKVKDELFPPVVTGKTVSYTPFNPKSPKQVQDWFKARGIDLAQTDKKTVKKVLEKAAKKRGLDKANLDEVPGLPEEIEALHNLYQFKDAGKGLKSWFDDRYLDKRDFVHPRFISTGTSMGRLASSRPNFTNIPARGFGASVKKALIPRDPSLELITADYSQLEFRKLLHSAGFDPRELKSDPFEGLVRRSAGQLKAAASFMHGSERDAAKILTHACLTGDHEVLTPEGWRRIDECSENTILAQWDDWNISFVKPQAYYKYEVEEDLVYLAGRGLETLCTSNHQLPWFTDGTWQGRQYSNFHKTPVGEITVSARIPVTGVLVDERPEMLDEQTIAHLSGHKYANFSDLKVSRVPYKGSVYCFTVPSGFFLVRYNGTISVTGNSNYLEGITVLLGKDLERRKDEIAAGCLLVYGDWEYRGGLVAFTGANLAERLFGNKTHESRKAALGLQALLKEEFPMIHQLHRAVLREVEEKRSVQLQTGRLLPLFGTPEDDAKMGMAMHGQGGGAEHVIGIMLRYKRELGRIPLLMVHDDLTWEIPRDWTDAQAIDFLELMSYETPRMPGFRCAMKAKRGPNRKEMRELVLPY